MRLTVKGSDAVIYVKVQYNQKHPLKCIFIVFWINDLVGLLNVKTDGAALLMTY